MTGGAVAEAAPPRPNEPILRWRSRVHSIEAIETELARIWAETNRAIQVDADGDHVNDRHVSARTSVMNLVVVARRPEVGERAAATIQSLTGRHPSRTMVIQIADPDGPSWIDALIVAHCVTPRDDAPETCAETIHLTCGGEAGRHLDAIVAPLLIHDLPVTIWWPDEAPFGSQQVNDLVEMADRLVIDGSSWHGTGLTQLRRVAAIAERLPIAISDFALIRQSRWREAIAAIFDIPDFMPYLRHVRRIAVAYAVRDEIGAETTNIVKPIYHAAWLGSRLGMKVVRPLAPMTGTAVRRAPVRGARATPLATPGAGLGATLHAERTDVAVVIRPVMSEMPPGTTLRVELLADWRGSELRADVTAEQEAVHVRVWQDGVHALERGFNAPRRTDVDLLAEAIEAGGRDPVSTGTLALAADLAGEPLDG
ncbi:MAG TPA: glucose-6-phosphate dehydrogenase assembly protein OpcA [Candidatus Limnocylindrales bacterium]|jgi:glucose-6-phosphate dehydrogenase assembly protein OpcA|nr:glucose-6-phosphate dehydrogenase assembly protein OpcA [Candidatus Limnocylindrales bacterium]